MHRSFILSYLFYLKLIYMNCTNWGIGISICYWTNTSTSFILLSNKKTYVTVVSILRNKQQRLKISWDSFVTHPTLFPSAIIFIKTWTRMYHGLLDGWHSLLLWPKYCFLFMKTLLRPWISGIVKLQRKPKSYSFL